MEEDMAEDLALMNGWTSIGCKDPNNNYYLFQLYLIKFIKMLSWFINVVYKYNIKYISKWKQFCLQKSKTNTDFAKLTF